MLVLIYKNNLDHLLTIENIVLLNKIWSLHIKQLFLQRIT